MGRLTDRIHNRQTGTRELFRLAGRMLVTLRKISEIVVYGKTKEEEKLEKTVISLNEKLYTDTLTGLKARVCILDEFQRAYSRIFRSAHQGKSRVNMDNHLCIAMIDVDKFKRINDEHGHTVGDEALKHIAKIFMEGGRRDDDIFIRYAGDEFMAIFTCKEPPTNASHLPERKRQTINATPLVINDKEIPLSISVGVAVLSTQLKEVPPADMENFMKRLIAKADKALYEAKAEGRNGCVIKLIASNLSASARLPTAAQNRRHMTLDAA